MPFAFCCIFFQPFTYLWVICVGCKKHVKVTSLMNSNCLYFIIHCVPGITANFHQFNHAGGMTAATSTKPEI